MLKAAFFFTHPFPVHVFHAEAGMLVCMLNRSCMWQPVKLQYHIRDFVRTATLCVWARVSSCMHNQDQNLGVYRSYLHDV